MTEQQLNAIFYINREIERLRKRITELEGLPSETELYRELNAKLEEKIFREIQIRKYIEGIEDPQIKAIAELRFLYQHSWVDIAAEVSPRWKDIDRTTVAKKLRRYLRKH